MRLGMGLGLGNLLSGQPLTGFPNDFSFNFDGSNDYLDIGSISLTGQFTVSFYCNINTSSQTEFVIGSTGSNKIGFLGGDVFVRAINGGSSDTSVSEPSSGSFHHIVVTRDSLNKVDLYLNGGSANRLFSDSAQSGTVTWNYVGRDSTTTQNFTGLIDEVAIWDTALSADDVAKIASKPVDFSKASTYATDRTSNLKLWLRAGDKAEPESTTAIARQDFYTDFDGTDDYVDTGTTLGTSLGDGYTGDLTFSFWIKIEQFPASGNEGIFAFMNPAGNTNSDIVMATTVSSSNDLIVRKEGATIVQFISNANTILGTGWNHISIIYKAGSSDDTIFINGILQSATNSSSFSSSVDLSGKRFDIGRYLQAELESSMSSFSIHQTALDAQTISQMAKSRFTPMRDNRFSVVDFDGSDDYISLGNADVYPDDIDAEEFTIAGWFNGTGGTIISKADTSNRAIHLYISGGVILKAGGTTINSGFTPTSGEWNHFSIVSFNDSGTYKCNIYINGDFKAVGTTGTTTATDRDLLVGARRASSNTDATSVFTGSISSISLYNTAKSAEEIYAIYQQGITYDESSLSGLVGYWRMGDDTSKAYPTIADSSSNSNDGTITNGESADIVQQMVAGWDLGSFESSSEELGGELSNKDFTGWTLDGSSNWSASSATSLSHTASSAGFASSPFSTVSGKIYKVSITINSGQTGTYKLQLGASSWLFDPTDGNDTWSGNHIFYVSNAGNSSNGFKIYAPSSFVGTFTDISVKEVLQSEVSDTYPAIIDVNEPVALEKVSNTDFTTTDGWNTASGRWTIDTSAGTVTSNNDSGFSPYLQCTLPSTTVFDDANAIYKMTITIDSCENFTQAGIVKNGSVSNFFGSFGISSTGTHTVYFTNTTTGLSVYSNGVVTSISHLSIKKVLGNFGTMTNQASDDLVYSSVLPDQSFLGTGVNSAYNFLDFDGTDAYVQVEQTFTSDNFALSFWINPDDVTSDKYLFDQNAGICRSVVIGYQDGYINFINDDNDAGNYYPTGTETDTQIPVSVGEWQHYVMMTDGTKVYGYKNGVEVVNITGKWGASGAEKLWIGQYESGNNYNGKITAVGIWNKTLSSSEISSIYSAGRHTNLLDSYSDNLKAYFAFGALDAVTGFPDTDSTIYDRSGNSNHGTTSGTATGDLKSPPNAEPNGYAKGDTNRSTTTP